MKPILPEWRFLVEAERSRPDAPAQAKAAAQVKLGALLGPIAGLGGGEDGGGDSGPAGSGPATGSAGADGAGAARGAGVLKGASAITAAKVLAVFAVGGLAGGGVATALIRPMERIVYVERSVPAAPAIAPPPQVPAARNEVVPAVSAVPAPSTPKRVAASPAMTSLARSRDTDLAAERAIIERARSALARGDSQGALVSIAQHESAFARGQLVEEREVVAVQALVTAGRAQEAAARGVHFRRTFPNSLLLPLVDQALR